MLLETYSPSHMRAIVRQLGLHVVSETSNDFLCLCPFHGNRHTPSFSVSHQKGLYLCFNPSCGASGTIVELVKNMTKRNEYEALRFILSAQVEAAAHFEDELAEILDDKPEYADFDQNVLDRLHSQMNDRAREYLNGRGIDDESIDHFKLGYSASQDMVIVPVHSPDGIPVGLVGRSIEGKSFKNSTGLPRNKTMFNIHRAKRMGGSVIVVESSFDAIRVHQSGYPNVVATLGGFMSKINMQNLNRNFTKIIIMTDADQAGRELGKNIAETLKNKEILWAHYSNDILYPHDAKDVGDMTEEEIRTCIENSLADYEYRMVQ
jgi:DNA primase